MDAGIVSNVKLVQSLKRLSDIDVIPEPIVTLADAFVWENGDMLELVVNERAL